MFVFTNLLWYCVKSPHSQQDNKQNAYRLERKRDFPGGTVAKNLPAKAEDRGSSPGQGWSHMPWSNEARAPQLLSLCSRAHEPQLLSLHATTTEARVPRVRAPQQEKPPQ